MTLIDAQARQQALDISQSYIVQAPAGSGKTGVLTQRILKLLTVVDRPEEILGITFTKKAAAEMRNRVLEALQLAEHETPPADSYEFQFYTLAKEVIARDNLKQWGLRKNLNRLRLVTIDSFCSSIVRSRPLTSGLGINYGITEDASELYGQASQALLHSIDEDSEVGTVVKRVLAYLDNNYYRFETLISQMLMSRDHWLGDVISLHNNMDAFKSLLEDSLYGLNQQTYLALNDQFGGTLCEEINALATFAKSQLIAAKAKHDLLGEHNTEYDEQRSYWRLFFTKDKKLTLRSKFDKRDGFPVGESSEEKAECKANKQRAKTVVEKISGAGEQGLELVNQFLSLPSPHIDASQWHLLQDLMTVVSYAAAHLKLIFQQQKTVDFSEVALSALSTLGESDNPTDITLLLDEIISHILVDEFQDTSILQVDLLEKLTAGWQSGDQRTLFLVGDPMQSIYGFRQADVGLFLKLWQQQRLGDVTIQPLSLATNFRSAPAVIDWVNDRFKRCFPAVIDIRRGAVPYAMSKAATPPNKDAKVVVQLFLEDSAQKQSAAKAEADYIVDHIKQLDRHKSVAILVKGKSHMLAIGSALRHANLPYQAVDMEPLSDNQLIIDLLNLIRAYQSPNDRTAWFGLLRGPWCGLTLAELTELSNLHQSPWRMLELALASDGITLSDFAMSRLNHVHQVFSRAYENRNRGPWHHQLRELALQLGIPATATTPEDLEALRLFFELLDDVQCQGDTPDLDQFCQRLARLFVPPQTQTGSEPPIQIMTMHKSKGLEFDVVFLPQLQRQARNDDRPMILVDKQTSLEEVQQELFIAPINLKEETNSVYQYLWDQQRQRQSNEIRRLLYVACTRAKSQLILTGSVALKDDASIKAPNPNCLLGVLWPQLEGNVEVNDLIAEQANSAEEAPTQQHGFRIPTKEFINGLVLDQTQSSIRSTSANNATEPQAGAESSLYQRIAGILFHQLMEQTKANPSLLDNFPLDQYKTYWRHELQKSGFNNDELNEALSLLERAATGVCHSQHRAWLFGTEYDHDHAEFAVTQYIDGDYKQWILDRTFTHNNTRYIIDYKLSQPQPGTDIDNFLVHETAVYASQLASYKNALNAISPMTTKAYLFFPLIDHLHEVKH